MQTILPHTSKCERLRREIDSAVFGAMGLGRKETDELLGELYPLLSGEIIALKEMLGGDLSGGLDD